MREFAEDMEAVCPDAIFLNYTNPMAMLSGYMQRYTKVNTIGLCHSVQVCVWGLYNTLGLELPEGYVEKIAGINHMAWLLEIKDKNGVDLYPEIKSKVDEYIANPDKYGLSEDGMIAADVVGNGNGITADDAIAIQKLDAKLIEDFSELE